MKDTQHGLNVTLSVQFDNEFVDDVMSAAFDGGISYWAEKASPKDGDFKGAEFASDVISRGGSIIITLDESINDDGILDYELNMEKFTNGLKLFLSNNPSTPMENQLDACDIDAIAADLIVQYALFGEVVFG